MMAIDRATLVAWVQSSCDAQGVPMVVVDSEAIAQIGVLLRGRGAAGRVRSTDRGTRPSAGPGGSDAVRVEASIAARGNRIDGGEI